MNVLIVKCDLESMEAVRDCINSNYLLYRPIIDEVDRGEHRVDGEWAKRNWRLREFFLLKLGGNGEYVGTASYQNFGEFAYIGYFYIKNGHHGAGYGKQLMAFMEQRTRRDGIRDLRLFTNSRATWALDFYERLGFKVFLKEKQDILSIRDGIMVPFYEEHSWFLKKNV
ncbi:MAG: GNAT family N-acetyltransferase [Promethearchaeota archaeon]